MITDDPLIRLKRIKQSFRFIPVLFLKLITSIIKLASFIVKSIYDGYMRFKKFATGRHHGIWIVFLILIIILISSIVYVRHQEIKVLQKQKQEIQQENENIKKELQQHQESIKELETEIQEKDAEIEKLSYVPPKITNKPQIASQNVAGQSGTLALAGKVSHYSRAGCLGCSPNLTMANGQPLDDNRLTIAVPPGTIPMNTQVKLVNETNGKEVIATVTDTGGFAKYNRVADLTPAVANALGTQTDISHVRIEVLQ